MIRALLALITVLLLAGCAATQRSHDPSSTVRTYIDTNRPLAESGALKWSEYFKGVYRAASNAGAPGEMLGRINDSIRHSEQYEAGTISKEEFGYRMRALDASNRSAEQLRMEQARAEEAQRSMALMAAGVQMMQASQPRPLIQPAVSAPAMTLPGFLQSQSVNGVLRYCRYNNGVVMTIGSIDLCPLKDR